MCVKLQIWEIAGSEELYSKYTNYLNAFNCILFIYDVSNPESFEKVESLFKSISSQLPQEASKILVGNKNDLFVLISYEEGKGLADKLGIQFIETSASSGSNIHPTFFVCISEYVSKRYSHDLKSKH